MIRGRWGRFLAALSALGLAVGLSACSANPGVALEVGDTTYTEADITTALDQYSEMFGQDAGRQEFVWTLARYATVIPVGDTHGVSVTEQDVTDQLQAAVDQQQIASVPDSLNHALSDLLRAQLVVSGLQSAVPDTQALNDELTQALSSTDVSMNPRYGAYSIDGTPGSVLLGDVVDADELAAATGPGQSGDGSGQSGN